VDGDEPARIRSNAVRALAELHATGTIHRNLSPRTILIKHDNSPILTGFEPTKIPSEISVASSSLPTGQYPATVPPEVQAQGMAFADQRSDLYSLCACLSHLFQSREDDLSQRTAELFAGGLATEPDQRGTLQDLDAALSKLLDESVPPPAPPPARFWTEDQVIRIRDRDDRIVSRLGSGGVGTTFKVVEIDRSTREDLGTYVAKVAHNGETGQRVLKAYSLVRSHLRHTALSMIFEVASEWQENEFVALMTWISGAPLAEFAGVCSRFSRKSSRRLRVRPWLALAAYHLRGAGGAP
jgi:serine/threonine protein kinase